MFCLDECLCYCGAWERMCPLCSRLVSGNPITVTRLLVPGACIASSIIPVPVLSLTQCSRQLHTTVTQAVAAVLCAGTWAVSAHGTLRLTRTSRAPRSAATLHSGAAPVHRPLSPIICIVPRRSCTSSAVSAMLLSKRVKAAHDLPMWCRCWRTWGMNRAYLPALAHSAATSDEYRC